MGSFSWLRATKTTKRKNVVEGDKYKILIPEEFGGGFIIDTYFGYGYVFEYDDTKPNADLYGILAYWNKCKGMQYEGDEYPSTMKDILERGNTCLQNNRSKGIDIGCYDDDVDRLRYKESTGQLINSTMNNPAIFVPELKKIIYGCESWWKTIQSVDEFSKISNEDINNTWYVKLLQSLNHTEEK